MFIRSLFSDPLYYFSWISVVVVSVCLHELSHACTAHLLGDDTAYNNGYSTFNPLKLMGWMSIACLFLFGFCWGAVPVQDDRKSVKTSIISAAGPLSNLLIAVVFSAIWRLGIVSAGILSQLLAIFVFVNCILFVFNLIPIPEFDGWGILEPFVPPMQKISWLKRQTISRWAIFILWCTPVSELVLSPIYETLGKLLLGI